MVILLLNFLIRTKLNILIMINNKQPINFKDKNSNDQTEKNIQLKAVDKI